eukprot:PhM_4_TR13107/c0_g1_i1/m.63673
MTLLHLRKASLPYAGFTAFTHLNVLNGDSQPCAASAQRHRQMVPDALSTTHTLQNDRRGGGVRDLRSSCDFTGLLDTRHGRRYPCVLQHFSAGYGETTRHKLFSANVIADMSSDSSHL